ncbi:MAG: hypothetical protein RI995_1180 [Bacteroidota bacterium]|jgi:rare lipoprotein A
MQKSKELPIRGLLTIVYLITCILSPFGSSSQNLGDESIGVASFYSNRFYKQKTASQETLKKKEYTAAHKSLPFNCLVEVTNLQNKRSVIVRINDRGPYKKGRIIDLTEISAKRLGIKKVGLSRVRLKIVGFEKELMLIPYDHLILDSNPRFSRKFYQKTKLRYKKKYRLKKKIRHKKYLKKRKQSKKKKGRRKKK